MKKNILRYLFFAIAFAMVLGLISTSAVLAEAATTTTVNRVDVNLSLFNPCVPESVSATMTLTIVDNRTEDENGNVHISGHFSASKGEGTGNVTGNSYVVILADNGNSTFTGSGASPLDLISEITTINVIELGKGNVSRFNSVFHFTINANGDATAEVELDHTGSVCAG